MTDSKHKSKFWDGFNRYFQSGKLVRSNAQIDSDGLASVSLQMFFGSQTLAKGSGFFWRLPGEVALVTAWHNFSGLHHMTRQPMAKSGGVPDRIVIRYTPKKPDHFQEQTLRLYIDDDMQEPRWFVHSECGSYFDLGAIVLQLNNHEVFCANDQNGVFAGRLLPGSDVFVVGYPQGVSTLGVIPIWKRGSLASEIDLPTEGHPKFLIDIAGRGGLSGAPVYRVQRGVVVEGEPSQMRVGFGNKTEFLGIYTGRAADQLPPDQRSPETSDLGFVWRPEIVVETLTSRVPDEKPEVGKGKLEVTPLWQKAPAPPTSASLE